MALKVAKVIALFKKGDKNQPNNYRPISLLSCFNIIFEKLLCKRLVKFLEVNRILFEYQYGFRKLYSTTLALIEFTDNIIKFLDEGQYCMSIFVDLTKAFDTVDHEILLDKLDRYGIGGHANRFFRSYLSDRHQYTVINGVKSTLKDITCGVPSKHDGTNTVPFLYHFLPVCTGSTGYRSTVQYRYCFRIGFHYWPVPFIRYWAIPFSYKYLIQRQNCTSVLVFPTRYILQWKLNFVYIVSNSNIIWCSEICLYSYRKYYMNRIYM